MLPLFKSAMEYKVILPCLYKDIGDIFFLLPFRPSLTIHNRMEYLSRAVVTTKSSSATAHSNEGEFLQEIEEKLDVRKVFFFFFTFFLFLQKRSKSPFFINC